MAIDTTRQLIEQIRNASAIGENTATRVGNAMEAMLNDVKTADDKANAATSRINTTEQGIANANQRLTTEEGVNAVQTAQIEGLRQDIQNIRPVTIEGDVVNNPDNVFLTSANDEITPKERTTSLSAKGHYIMRPTDNFAAKLKANYIHEIPFDVDLGGASVTIPAGAVLKFTGGKISGGSLVLQNTYLDGDVKLAADVAVSGTCANFTAKQSWFADNDIDSWHKFISNVECPCYEFVKGDYTPNTTINVANRKSVKLIGNGAKLLYTNAVVGMGKGAIVLNEDGEYNGYESLTVSAAIPSESETISMADVSTLNVGDVIQLQDVRNDSFCPQFQNGEYVVVRAIDDVNKIISLTSPTYGNYPDVNNIAAYKVQLTDVQIDNLNLKCTYRANGNDFILQDGFKLNHCIGKVNNVDVNGFCRCVTTYYGYNISIDGIKVCPLQRVSPNSGYIDCYGICIANSQKISITNSAVGGGQHAITTGGSYNGAVFAIPCREIFITNNSIYNENAGLWASIGFHPNTEYCIISGNTMGGIALVGGHMTVTNNIFKKQTNSDISISLSSLLNYNFVIEGNQMVGGISMSDMADLSSYPNITPYSKAETLSIKNNIGVGYCYMIGKHDAINAANAKIEIEGNSFTNTSDDYFGSNVPIRIANNEFFGRILVPYSNGIEFNDNRFAGASKLQFGVGNITGTLEDVSVKNNIFNDTDAWSITMLKSCDNLYVEGNVFKQYKALYLNTGLCQNVTIDHNIFTEEFSGNYYRGDCSKLYFGGQRFLNGELNTFDSHNDISAAINLPIKEVNIIYPKFGTTANRPSLPLMYKGYGYYDESIAKQLFYAPAKLTQLSGIRHEANTSTPILTQNTLAIGMYFVTTARAGRHVLAFSKTNTATDIADIYNSDMMIVIDAAVSAAFETSIIAPDPNVYPYIYSYINATSIEVFRIYSAKGWVEADGATAGVLRSGTTANRPASGDIYAGFQYFDTDLSKPIFAKTISGNTVTWVDATGATV